MDNESGIQNNKFGRQDGLLVQGEGDRPQLGYAKTGQGSLALLEARFRVLTAHLMICLISKEEESIIKRWIIKQVLI